MRLIYWTAVSVKARFRGRERSCGKGEALDTILNEHCEVREHTIQFGLKLGGLKFVLVKWIGAALRSRFRVIAFVGRGDDEEAGGCEDARGFIEKATEIGQVLNYFESYDEIEGAGREGKIEARAGNVPSVGPRVVRARVIDGIVRQIEACRFNRRLGELSGAIAGAATAIEYAPAFRITARKGVTRQVLAPEVRLYPIWYDTLAREFSQVA